MNTILFQAFLSVSILTMLCLMIYIGICSWNSASSTSKEQVSIIFAETIKPTSPKPYEDTHREDKDEMNIGDYKATFLLPVRFAQKTTFTMNAETLDVLCHVLQDLDENVPVVAYIENILRQHLSEHKELLNIARDSNRKTQTIDP